MSTTAPAAAAAAAVASGSSTSDDDVILEEYRGEAQLQLIQSLMDADLSEPYSIFTYRYFIHQWPGLCFLATSGGECVGAVVSKLEHNKRGVLRGYIAMLAVRRGRRKSGLGTRLVRATIDAMVRRNCEEVVLEAEVSNAAALRLYQNLGFIRDKLLEKYYLNGNDAFRLKLRLRSIPPPTFRVPTAPGARTQNVDPQTEPERAMGVL